MTDWTAAKIRALRKRYGESQDVFCLRLGLSVDTLRWWEQEKGSPNGSAQILLARLDEDLKDGKVRPLPAFAVG